MSGVLHLISAIERMGNAAVDIAKIVTHHLGIPAALVADLAPPRLRGRYMALSTLSWEIGFVIGPTAAGPSTKMPQRP